jgi:hypothetical protein
VTHHLTERMPDVVHGRDIWTAADQAHLDRCAECAAEWQIISAVRVPPLESIDAEAVANGVLRRLQESPAVVPMRRPRTWRTALIGLAAAAALATVVLVRSTDSPKHVAGAPRYDATMLPELDGLHEAELELVLESVSAEELDPLGAVPSLGDLTEEELETLLDEVEG